MMARNIIQMGAELVGGLGGYAADRVADNILRIKGGGQHHTKKWQLNNRKN